MRSILVLSLLAFGITAFGDEVRLKACQLLLTSEASFKNAHSKSDVLLADAYKNFYSSLTDALGTPIYAIELEHVPNSKTLSKQAKKFIRRGPRPLLQSIRLLNAAAINAPLLGEINFRILRSGEKSASTDGATMTIEKIGVSPNFPELAELLTIERALLGRALSQNPDVRYVKLRISQDSVTAVDKALAEGDPNFDLTPSFAAAMKKESIPLFSATKKDAPKDKIESTLLNAAAVSAQKARLNVRTAARLKEMMMPVEGVEPSPKALDIARAALQATSEFTLANDLGFGTILNVGLGPEFNTLELVLGINPAAENPLFENESSEPQVWN